MNTITAHPELVGDVTVLPSLEIRVLASPGLELLFNTYEPGHLGVVDYHGAHRTYNREQLGGICFAPGLPEAPTLERLE